MYNLYNIFYTDSMTIDDDRIRTNLALYYSTLVYYIILLPR